MAISRRLRFEILRRDDYACRYCGRRAPDVALTVDHVIPTTLGGGDEPANLVTACQPCNAGKSSIAPDAPLVEDVAKDALRWKQAMAQASVLMGMEREFINADIQRFMGAWDKHTRPVERSEQIPAPPDPVTDPLLLAWRELGYPFNVLSYHVRPVSFVEGILTVQVEKTYLTDVRPKLKMKMFKQWIQENLGSELVSYQVAEGFDGGVPPKPRSTKKVWYEQVPYARDEGWNDTVNRLLLNGVPMVELERLIEVTMSKDSVTPSNKWRYFCGCAWRALTTLQESARRIIESEGADGS